MMEIDENITFYYLNINPIIGFTMKEFLELERIAFERVQTDNTPLFCQRESKMIGKFFMGFN